MRIFIQIKRPISNATPGFRAACDGEQSFVELEPFPNSIPQEIENASEDALDSKNPMQYPLQNSKQFNEIR